MIVSVGQLEIHRRDTERAEIAQRERERISFNPLRPLCVLGGELPLSSHSIMNKQNQGGIR